jgi:uncharacterized protein (TIRG00374 family)
MISRENMRRGLAGFAALTVSGLGILFTFTLRGDLSEVTQRLSFGFLMLAAVAAVVDCTLGGFRYHIFLRRIRPGTRPGLSIRADLVGRFTGAITPSQTGGGPGQIFVLYKGGIAMPDVLSVLMVNFVSTLLFFLLVGSAATWLMGEQFSSGAIRHLIQWGFLAFLGGMVFITFSVARPDLVARPIRRMMQRLEGNPKEWSRITRRSGRLLVESAEHYRESCIRCLREWPLLPVASFLLTAALYLNKFTLAWFVMRGLGVEGSYTTTLAVQALLHFVLYVAPTPGGSGIAELSTGALMAVLLPTHLLGPFTLAYRFFLTYLPAALGAFLLALTVRPRVRSTSVAQKAVVAGLLLALSFPAGPKPAIAQNGVVRVPAEVASLTSRMYERRSAMVRKALMDGIMATCREDSLAAFSLAVHTAQALVLSEPDDAEAHYLFAVALGHRLELSGTREKIRLGAATRAEAEMALALDPNHAGAHHVLGRLNAAAMRLSTLTRLVARRVLGAKALDGASWDQAEYHFSRALSLEPWNPRHSLELGVLYADTGRPSEAFAALTRAIAAPRVQLADSMVVVRAIRVRAGLECETCLRGVFPLGDTVTPPLRRVEPRGARSSLGA